MRAISALLQELDKVDKYPALYFNDDVLKNAIRRYEHVWIPLLTKVPTSLRTKLVPPLDVQWVWFCHMLCPFKYNVDSSAMWAQYVPAEKNYVVDHRFLTGMERARAERKARKLWLKYFPDEPFDVLDTVAAAPLVDLDEQRGSSECPIDNSVITYDILAATKRQMALHYQVSIMPQYRRPAFLRYAVARYGMFLELQREQAGQIWVPTFDMDIAWHTHMMHPVLYKRETEAVCGKMISHDDTLNSRKTGSALMVRWTATREAWRRQFGQPIDLPGGMWRGNVSARERALQSELVGYLKQVEEAFAPLNGKDVHVWDNTTALQSKNICNWDDINWVHATEWRATKEKLLADGDTPGSRVIERFLSFGPIRHEKAFLLGRTVHFQKHCTYRSFIEIFSADSGEVKAQCPFASAHDILPFTMQVTKSGRGGMFPGEKVLLLRVGGEDFALLGGRWAGFIPPPKSAPGINNAKSKDSYRAHEKDGFQGKPGKLSLRIWFLKKHVSNGWIELCARSVEGRTPPKFIVPINSNPLDAKPGLKRGLVEIDIASGVLKVSHVGLVVVGALIAMSAATLYVGLEPRFKPNSDSGTMYPAYVTPQGKYCMLRGVGAEQIMDGQRTGLSEMRRLALENLPQVRMDLFYSGDSK